MRQDKYLFCPNFAGLVAQFVTKRLNFAQAENFGTILDHLGNIIQKFNSVKINLVYYFLPLISSETKKRVSNLLRYFFKIFQTAGANLGSFLGFRLFSL